MNNRNPSAEIVEKYARILVNFALNHGKGIQSGDVVLIQADVSALPLARSVYKQVLLSKGHPIMRLTDESFEKIMFETADKNQLTFFPKKYMKSLIDVIDHRIAILSEADPLFLRSVDPKKIMLSRMYAGTVRKWIFAKEDAGKLSWTLALYGTPGLAKEAGLSMSDYWDEIAKACFLYDPDPIAKWKSVTKHIETIQKKLNAIPIDRLHIVAKDTDLWIKVGDNRQWLGGSGANIPSFELFTSPDWRGTEGTISFNYPLYRYGSVIQDIQLTFKHGRVIASHARKNEQLLKELIKQPNADKIGEYSLTDKRFSNITKFMANTLYDENVGGTFGNTHLALGTSFHDAYTKGTKGVSSATWKSLGFNESPEHCDIMATTDRTVTASLRGGGEKVIYASGQFVL